MFYLHRTESHRDLLNQILSWAFYHILIRMACKAEVLAGIGAAISDYLGKQEQVPIQLAALRALLVCRDDEGLHPRGLRLKPSRRSRGSSSRTLLTSLSDASMESSASPTSFSS